MRHWGTLTLLDLVYTLAHPGCLNIKKYKELKYLSAYGQGMGSPTWYNWANECEIE
jgi:hypothetical protein